MLFTDEQQLQFLAQQFIQLGGQFQAGHENACLGIIVNGIVFDFHFIGDAQNKDLLHNFFTHTQQQFETYQCGYEMVIFVQYQQLKLVSKQKIAQILKEFVSANGMYKMKMFKIIFGGVGEQQQQMQLILNQVHNNLSEKLFRKLSSVGELLGLSNQIILGANDPKIMAKL
eukprot:TRINITY_DN50806_c0_g1_i1.p1 TRINITY_DN50806_c0_g1~~TRINITY_DN50806_c0_g1_i1.p1  ORF type:complete len:196 (-),score=24.55 TRINITY_DN50806_c0_g1_i1:47-559(-)